MDGKTTGETAAIIARRFLRPQQVEELYGLSRKFLSAPLNHRPGFSGVSGAAPRSRSSCRVRTRSRWRSTPTGLTALGAGDPCSRLGQGRCRLVPHFPARPESVEVARRRARLAAGRRYQQSRRGRFRHAARQARYRERRRRLEVRDEEVTHQAWPSAQQPSGAAKMLRSLLWGAGRRLGRDPGSGPTERRLWPVESPPSRPSGASLREIPWLYLGVTIRFRRPASQVARRGPSFIALRGPGCHRREAAGGRASS